MDGAQFAKMLSDKHLFELNRMEYKYSTVSVKEFAELKVSARPAAVSVISSMVMPLVMNKKPASMV